MKLLADILKAVILYGLVWFSGILTAKAPGLLSDDLVARITSDGTIDAIVMAILAFVGPLALHALGRLRERFRTRLALTLPAGTTERELDGVEKIVRKSRRAAATVNRRAR